MNEMISADFAQAIYGFVQAICEAHFSYHRNESLRLATMTIAIITITVLLIIMIAVHVAGNQGRQKIKVLRNRNPQGYHTNHAYHRVRTTQDLVRPLVSLLNSQSLHDP